MGTVASLVRAQTWASIVDLDQLLLMLIGEGGGGGAPDFEFALEFVHPEAE